MTQRFLSAFFWLVACCGCACGQLVDELTPVYPDVAPAQAERLHLVVPRGGVVGVHVYLEASSEPRVVAWASGGRSEGPGGPRLAGVLRHVPVEVNTGTAGRTERYNNEVNPDVIRRAPFRTYDAVWPVRLSEGVRERQDGAVWVSAGDEPVVLRFEIRHDGGFVGEADWRLEIDGEVRGVVRVWAAGAGVPPTAEATFGFVNWINFGNAARYAATESAPVEPWSEAHFGVIEQYARVAGEHRQTMVRIGPGDVFDRETLELNEARLDRLIEMFERHGVRTVAFGQLAGRLGSSWNATAMQTALGRVPVESEAGEAELTRVLDQLAAYIGSRGLEVRWVQHIADEPVRSFGEKYTALASRVRDRLGVPIFEATMTESVEGGVDWWCPQVHQWQARAEYFRERQAAGDEVWVYTCLYPGGAWVNRLLDQARLRQVAIGWGLAANGLDGFLHWGMNFWRVDPFEQSVVEHNPPGAKWRLPAGDTHVVYPYAGGIAPSLRLAAHRTGLEDAELLRQLRERDPAAAERVTALVFRGFDDYETDASAYRAARWALMEALERVD